MKQQTFDSTLAYYVNQLDNMDKKLHEPLVSTTWGRDIKLRSGITMANESTSFQRSNFGSVGTQSVGGKSWINSDTTTLPGISINGERVVLPLRLAGREVTYSSVELERSQLIGQPIDVSKFNALQTMYQMEIDEMVYIGDTDTASKGLFNSALVAAAAVANGAAASPLWANKTPDEILKDINDMLQTAWAASGFAVCPGELRLPPAKFAYIAGQKVSTAGTDSILKYVEDNSIALRVNGVKLNVQPSKWLTGRGAGSVDRMVCYTNAEDRVRFPLVPIRRETPYYLGIKFNAPYIWALGEVEFLYPETVLYRDGI